MANYSSNKTSVPEAKEAMNRFKMEVASELGVPLKDGYFINKNIKDSGIVVIPNRSKEICVNATAYFSSLGNTIA